MLCMICDDQKSELETVQKIVEDYAGEHPDLFLSICCFSSPFDMLDEMDRSGAPDIALLDICMPGVLGTDIARKIQRKSEDVTDIVFLTNSPDFAVEAFALHVNDYLTKPYTKKRLTDTLDRVIEKRRRRLYVPIQCGNEIHRIDLYSVTYAEARNHILEIHLKPGTCLKTRMTLTELKELFRDASGFVAIGASYIVNLRCVQSVLPAALAMANGETVPVPRRLRSEVKQQYFDFYTREATGR
ncbi:MAG: LytTR family DNA-binding domain-containing protein [Clostridiales bacterium]|nr:LytTR family DNA-binding domain-containing protein [Clostridiales bacterium]